MSDFFLSALANTLFQAESCLSELPFKIICLHLSKIVQTLWALKVLPYRDGFRSHSVLRWIRVLARALPLLVGAPRVGSSTFLGSNWVLWEVQTSSATLSQQDIMQGFGMGSKVGGLLCRRNNSEWKPEPPQG